MSRAWERYDDPDTPFTERHDPDDIRDEPVTEERIQAIKDAAQAMLKECEK